MTELSNITWVISISFIFAAVVSQDGDFSRHLKNTAFECDLDIDSEHWILHCESVNFQIDRKNNNEFWNFQNNNQSNQIGSEIKFFIVQLEGFFITPSPIDFYDLLHSTSISESKLYSCDSFLRDSIQIFPFVVKNNCADFGKYIKKVIPLINESFVTHIEIQNVSNFTFMIDIFRELPFLAEIKISNSSLPNLTSLPFYISNAINTLILQMNRIKNITENDFKNIPNLEALSLSKNFLTKINKHSFGVLRIVRTLDLSLNLIETITNDAFTNIPYLEKLYLQNNNLQGINDSIFRSNKMLQILDISNNNIKVLSPKLFQNLPYLANISCSNCSLHNLDVNLFTNSSKLRSIIFSNNYIESIPEDIFVRLKFLETVNLGFNNIKTINRNIFRYHDNLVELNFTQNNIKYLENGIFGGLSKIIFLDLSKNKLEVLKDEYVTQFIDLEFFYLEHNRIIMVELGQSEDIFIRNLLISNNLISNLKINWKKMYYLEKFEIDNNQLENLNIPPCIPSVKQTITFTFKNNKISRLNLNALISDEMQAKAGRKMPDCFFNGMEKNFVDLTNNPLICDCHLYSFYRYIKSKTPRQFQMNTFLNKDNLTCAEPQFLQNETITSIASDYFSCSFTKECPLPCRCAIRGQDNKIFLNCSASNIESVPQIIPEGTTVLYFNKNNLQSMISLNSNVWTNLVELYLDDNFISSLDDWLYPKSLHYLSVKRNKLKTLPAPFMQFIQSQSHFQLFFGGNNNNCTCDQKSLKNFLFKNQQFIGDLENIICKDVRNGTLYYLPLISMHESELCPQNFEGLNYSQRRRIISVCMFFIILILVLLSYYKHKQLMLSFFYVHCYELFKCFYTEDNYDEDKIFDAFIAYSSRDRDIVMEMLQELENHPPYFKLCIHERNWLPGRFICDNILNSVTNSKRIIIVLSDSFISSPWFNLELRAAISRMSQEKIYRIIVILTKNTVSLSDVDPELQYVILKRTYLVWKERWFWEKLKYAMPRIKRVMDDDTVIFNQNRTSCQLLLISNEV